MAHRFSTTTFRLLEDEDETPVDLREAETCCFCIKQIPMPLEDQLRLSAFQKFKKYRRIPFKLLCNIALLILSTLQVVMCNIYVDPYLNANADNFDFILSPPALLPTALASAVSVGDSNQFYIYYASDFVGLINATVQLYSTLSNVTLDRFEYIPGTEIQMVVDSYTDGVDVFNSTLPYSSEVSTSIYSINSTYLGPLSLLDDQALLDYVHSILKARIEFSVIGYQLLPKSLSSLGSSSSVQRVCYRWNVMCTYDFSSRGHITYNTDAEPELCSSTMGKPLFDRPFWFQVWLPLLIGILAGSSQVLHSKALLFQARVFIWTRQRRRQELAEQQQQQQQQSPVPSAASSSLSQPLLLGQTRLVHSTSDGSASWSLYGLTCFHIFNLWFVVASLANLCQIIQFGMALTERFQLQAASPTRTIFSALGCFFSWALVMQYFEESKLFYALIATLRTGLPRVARFLIGVLPIYLGYVFLGVALFAADSDLFASVDMASVTLFSVMNGDALQVSFSTTLSPSLTTLFVGRGAHSWTGHICCHPPILSVLLKTLLIQLHFSLHLQRSQHLHCTDRRGVYCVS